MFRPLHFILALCVTLLTAICVPPFDAYAQASEKSADAIQPIRSAHPVWLLEQPYADNPMLTARTYGDSAYGDYHVNATLLVSCHPQTQGAGLALQIAPAALGFDSDPFEGPDATADGPLRITIGKLTTVDHQVSGSWNYGGFFQVGAIFAISTRIPRAELAYWASDASRGQSLNLSLAPAKAGDKRLTAAFSLPENNDGLKQVIQRCLGAAKVAPQKPKRD
ncbi:MULTISPECIES: hypothetical protein [unclassified Pseudomonas]|uniref:hypothetical protein n=1 Tax=unclassified Pseudomonas TaxID=196821 RepID=UPI0039E034E7